MLLPCELCAYIQAQGRLIERGWIRSKRICAKIVVAGKSAVLTHSRDTRPRYFGTQYSLAVIVTLKHMLKWHGCFAWFYSFEWSTRDSECSSCESSHSRLCHKRHATCFTEFELRGAEVTWAEVVVGGGRRYALCTCVAAACRCLLLTWTSSCAPFHEYYTHVRRKRSGRSCSAVEEQDRHTCCKAAQCSSKPLAHHICRP